MNFFFYSYSPYYYYIYPEADDCLWLTFELTGSLSLLLRNGLASMLYQRGQGITQYDRERYLNLSRVFLGSK